MERKLYFTPGSPFARAIRIILDEIGLSWQPELANIKDSIAERARRTPALQVPTLFEDNLVLWDSSVIADYLMTTYPGRPNKDGLPPLAKAIARPDHEWSDKRLFATIQTLGQSTVLISQMRWSGTKAADNAHIARNAERIAGLLDWFEAQLPGNAGFLPGGLSAQDIFCICHLMFITHRPLEIDWDRARTPKLAALHDRLGDRPSFIANSIEWWEPGMPA